MCISWAFSNSYRPNPSPHKQRWTRVSRIFFWFSTLYRVGEGRTARKFRKGALFYEGNWTLQWKALVSDYSRKRAREVARESLFSKASSLGLGSAVGKKSKKRGPPPFLLPRLPLGSPCSPIFFSANADFFSFFPQCEAWSQASKHLPLTTYHFFEFLRWSLTRTLTVLLTAIRYATSF